MVQWNNKSKKESATKTTEGMIMRADGAREVQTKTLIQFAPHVLITLIRFRPI